MAPKYHPTPLSGGDRKALTKELGKARAMANILAAQSVEMRARGEAMIQQADRLLCESWNEDAAITPCYCSQPRRSRRAFTFAGCIAELVRLAVESHTLESFSLEHGDPKRILAALLTLGLDGHANTNYSLGLRRALGLKRATTEQQKGSRHG